MLLDTGQGHQIYVEQRGEGIPALVLHGGPGSGCTPAHYDLFDLNRFCVTLMDQRGCGRSQPNAADQLRALDRNTTQDLIQDIEQVRQSLGVDQWVVFGGSWGSTLAMAYAAAHPHRVSAMVLAGVATTTARDLQWLYGDIGNLFPEAYDAFTGHVPEVGAAPEDTQARIAAYAARLRDPSVCQAAADAWCQWETAIFGGDIRQKGSRYADPRFRLGFARLVTHYFTNGAWLDDGQIQRDVGLIAHIPCTLIHSRFDPSCPFRAAWDLSRVWHASTLQVLEGMTHSALDTDMKDAVRHATDALVL
ncbi:prolyl aminopeptidase [uncultured Tateyamaria sp.]|uniref:prolyl aminopeptidase n=1 Tax=uncultured Tateyamaria sp. TaxID=455651 RepID=UPI0026235B59|nr:prolyl aminopeptidase [uncultured Tateyamaria sp.]